MTAGSIQLDDVLITDQLKRRPKRLANISQELSALREIDGLLTERSATVVNALCQCVLSLCDAGSAGISILRHASQDEWFHWDAIIGKTAQLKGGRAPRHDSPCGVCVDANAPQLFSRPDRHFGWMQSMPVTIVESLVVPLYWNSSTPFGTIWIFSHDAARNFDKEDVRILRAFGTHIAAGLENLRRAV